MKGGLQTEELILNGQAFVRDFREASTLNREMQAWDVSEMKRRSDFLQMYSPR